MQSTYYPNKWAIIKLTKDNNCVYKVLAGFFGGYIKADSWKLNSGIVSYRTDHDNYLFDGYSGSVYVCNKKLYGFSSSSLDFYNKIKRQAEGQDEIVLTLFSNVEDFIKDFQN